MPPTDTTMHQRNVLFLVASARRDGNTERLARQAAASLPPDTEQIWLRLLDLSLPPFEDLRHSGDGTYPAPAGNAKILFDATLAATDLVFVAPLYWYSLPAAAKLYLDYWSAWMRVPGADFRARMAGKTVWAITVISDEDPRFAEPLIGTLTLCAQYLKMRWGGSLLGYGNHPGDIARDERALAAATHFFAAGAADDGAVAVNVAKTGTDRYIITATAMFDQPVDAVWALLDDFEKFVAMAVPGLSSDFEWLNGARPGQVPARFQLIAAGERLFEEVYHRDQAQHILRYRMLEPALGILTYDAVFTLTPTSDSRTSYSIRREVTLQPGAVDGLTDLIKLETQNLKDHFAKKQ